MNREAIEYYNHLTNVFNNFIEFLRDGGNSIYVTVWLERNGIKKETDINYKYFASSNCHVPIILEDGEGDEVRVKICRLRTLEKYDELIKAIDEREKAKVIPNVAPKDGKEVVKRQKAIYKCITDMLNNNFDEHKVYVAQGGIITNEFPLSIEEKRAKIIDLIKNSIEKESETIGTAEFVDYVIENLKQKKYLNIWGRGHSLM